MMHLNPLVLVGAVIGVITALLVAAYAAVKDKKTAMGFERNMEDGEIMRRLARYARPYLSKFLIVGVLMLFSIAYDIISPLIVGRIEELVAGEFELRALFLGVSVYAGVLVFSMGSTYLQAVILQRVGQRIISDLREDLFTHIESLSHEQLNEIPVGKLVTRVTNDTNAISMMFTNLLVNLIKNAFVILGILVAMLCLNYALTLMVLCFVPFIVIFTVIFRKFSRRAYRKVKDATTDINTYLSENLSGIKVTQIFGREDEKMEDFRQKSQKLARANQEQIFVFSVFRPLVYMLYVSSILCLFYLGGMLGQLLGNYAAWMDSGGVSGENTMKPVSWNPLICFPAAFSGNGIKGILMILLIAGAIFGGSAWVSTSAYFIGMAAIIVSGIMLKKTKMFSGDPAPFVMELPAYHWPTLGNVLRSMWERGWSFIKKAGTIILLSTIVVWFTSYFGFVDGHFGMLAEDQLDESLLAKVGSAIAWIFIPLGWGNWQAAVASITGLVAKENIVGTMGILYGAEGNVYATLAKAFTGLTAYSFLVFNLLCAPCFAAIGAIKREMNSAKWTWFAIGYQCGFAYVVSLMINQFGNLFTGNIHGAVDIVSLVFAFAFLALIIFMLVRPYKEATKLASDVKVTK